MATKKKMLEAAAGNAGGASLDITDVFSTYLYEGTGDNQTNTVTNGLDLSGEGGMVWTKGRDIAYNPIIFDSERGLETFLYTNGTAAQENQDARSNMSFNSGGYSFGSTSATSWGPINEGNYNFASWTFRKAPKFFDVVTWTGDGTTNRQISHSLNSTVGFITIKRTDSSTNWASRHRSLGEDYVLNLNTSAATFSSGTRTLTSDYFTVGNGDVLETNQSGGSYVAYLFAHNDGDGDFGPDGDQDIIKCGSYTGNDGILDVNLGFEPQFVLIKNASSASDWNMYDTMRGFPAAGDHDSAYRLFPNQSGGEGLVSRIGLTSTGFGCSPASNASAYNASGDTYIYMAIRRGPLAPPEAGTEVFDVKDWRSMSGSFVQTGFPVDLSIWNYYLGTGTNSVVNDRLRGVGSISGVYASSPFLTTSNTNAEDTSSNSTRNYNNVGYDAASGDAVFWSWKRAPSFCDVVAYTGDDTVRNVPHNLGVAPEMFWIKARTTGPAGNQSWYVWHKDLSASNDRWLNLNTGSGSQGPYDTWNYTAPTDTVFTVKDDVKVNKGADYIAYLFSSLAGVSKVSSYTGNGSSQTINAGFTSGARFILIKRTDSGDDWYVWDTERGIVAGNDPHLSLNNAAAEITSDDSIDPDSSGFIVNQVAATNINVSSATYIYYAVA